MARLRILDALQSDDLFERAMPWTFARALMKYPDVPGKWLFNGWEGNEQIVGADEPEKLLARVARDHSHGQSPAATRAKFMILRAWFKAKRMHLTSEIAQDWGEIFPRYPDDITEDERQRIEPSIRAAFLATAGVDSNDGNSQTESVALKWAKTFWQTNWKLYGCAVVPSNEGTETPDVEEARREAMQQARASWRERLDQLSEEFLTVARAANPDLYAPDKHEVLTGIAYRALRDLLVLIGYPALWTMEHGASYIRSLVEARIVFKWLVLKNDPELYSRFKSYGRGRLKLFKLHLEEYRDGLGGFFAVSSGLLRVRWGQVMYAGLGLVRVGRVSFAAVR